MNNFILSVLIPTRNRQRYAEAAVRGILAIDSDIQIVIQDNSDDMSLRSRLSDVIERFQIKYNYVAERLASIDNFNQAAELADGEYVIAIGDDDILLPNAASCARWMKRNGIDLLSPKREATYRWPDDNSKKFLNRVGYLLYMKARAGMRGINTKRAVVSLIKDGGYDYFSKDLAGTYHCIASKKCMDIIKKTTGRYYGGLSPDMYSAVCLSLIPGVKAVEIGFPVSILGICPTSTSADEKGSNVFGELSKAPHFIGMKTEYDWDGRIMPVYCPETIWAETMVKAVCLMGNEELVGKYFDAHMVNQRAFTSHENLRDMIQELCPNENFILDGETVNPKASSRLKWAMTKFNMAIVGQELFVPCCRDIGMAVSSIMAKWKRDGTMNRWKELVRTDYK